MSIESRGRPVGRVEAPPAGWQVEHCQRCGTRFECGAALPEGTACWCLSMPPLTEPGPAAGSAEPARCLCPGCLREAVGAQWLR